MELDILRSETENRIRNLIWTVSGDYSIHTSVDVDLFLRSRNRGLMHAIREGAFFRYFDRREFSLYILKKLYYDADDVLLGRIVGVVMDGVAVGAFALDHPGVVGIHRKAADDYLDMEFSPASQNRLGRFFLTYYGRIVSNRSVVDETERQYIEWMEDLSEELIEQVKGGTLSEGEKLSPAEVIELVDRLYNQLADPGFEARHGDLRKILDVTLEELAEADFDWQDFLKEEAGNQQLHEAESGSPQEYAAEHRKRIRSEKFYEATEESNDKVYRYMELNYGRSYMKPLEQKRMNYTLCRGVHENCSLYFTDGILGNQVRKNYQSEYVRRQKEFNLITYARSMQMANRNIQLLSDTMRQALVRRAEKDLIRSNYGRIRPRELWKVGRTEDDKLFHREISGENSDFVVDILMDASGSQRDRRGAVAVQGFIISEALSIVGIPHRVQSFCTCWDYTILERFREYDDPRDNNRKIFEFSTSANNRDGLAIKAVTNTLLRRNEDHKILIILSDGRPNDRIVNRSAGRSPVLYVGDFAVHDTAEEVRRARNAGVAVLGVFAGEEEDLAAEKRIFGRDFAYIRNIQNFSHVVGRYLRKQLDVDDV